MLAKKELSLYHISKEFQELAAQLYDPETGEVNQEVEAQLTALLPSVETKCIAVAHWIKKLEAEQKEIDFFKEELRKREEAYTESKLYWQDYLKKNMEFNGMTKISCPYFTLNIKTNPYSTDVYDEFQLPAKYLKSREVLKVETKPDKEMIKAEVLATGIQVPGATVARKTKLEILVDKL